VVIFSLLVVMYRFNVQKYDTNAAVKGGKGSGGYVQKEGLVWRLSCARLRNENAINRFCITECSLLLLLVLFPLPNLDSLIVRPTKKHSLRLVKSKRLYCPIVSI